jgi:hypothetical protein
MEKVYVMKCSSCYHLLPLEEFDSKYINCKITSNRYLIKKKTCRDCLINVSQSHARFIDRHGVNYYQYRLKKN